MSSFTTTICDRCKAELKRQLPGGVVHWELKENWLRVIDPFGTHVADICTKCGHEAFGAPE